MNKVDSITKSFINASQKQFGVADSANKAPKFVSSNNNNNIQNLNLNINFTTNPLGDALDLSHDDVMEPSHPNVNESMNMSNGDMD